MNKFQLWNKLLQEGVEPIDNQIILQPPLKIKSGNNIKFITKLIKTDNDIKLFAANQKYSGRLAK